MKVNLRSIDLNLLIVFEAIMTEGKLSAAAEKLGMTQSAASGALARLRVTFDDDLFVRTHVGLVPTPRAEQLIVPIREGLSCISGAFSAHQVFDPISSHRVFNIMIGAYGEILLLPLLLKLLRSSENNLSLKTFQENMSNGRELMRQGQIDLQFDYKVPADNQFEHEQFAQIDLAVVSKKDHPRLEGEISVGDYLRERHIVYTSGSTELTGLERVLDRKDVIPRKIMASVTQISAVPSLVESTDAISTMAKPVAEYYASKHNLDVYRFPFDTGPLLAYMIWHKSLNRDLGHQWLRSQITEQMGGSS